MRQRFGRRLLLLVLVLLVGAAATQVFVYFQVRGSTATAVGDAARDAAAHGGTVAGAAARAEQQIRDDVDDRDAAAITCTSATGRDANTGLPTVTVRCQGRLRLLFTDRALPVTVDESSTVVRQD